MNQQQENLRNLRNLRIVRSSKRRCPQIAQISQILIALVLCATSLRAQRLVPMNVLAFADTSGVRFEIRSPNGELLTGATVTARIVSTADKSVLWAGSLGTLADSAGTARLVK